MAKMLRTQKKQRRISCRAVAVIVTHVRGTGPAIHLETYLTQQCPKVSSIFSAACLRIAAMSSYDYSRMESWSKQASIAEGAEPVIRLQEVILTIRWVRQFSPKSDLFIGVDALKLHRRNHVAGNETHKRVSST